MDYWKARSLIDESLRFGGEISLKPITNLLRRLGNPQNDLKFIHLAGTNGKGSTGAYLEFVLREAGYRVGRFISPTLYEYRERIQINGEYISEESFGKWMDPVFAAIDEMKHAKEQLPSPFEIETALSFLYFREETCDLVLLECGMGGRLDATNVITSTVLSVITSISMDHMEYLGDTLEKIAGEKAGIIKEGVPAATCMQKPEVLGVLERTCREKNARFILADSREAVVKEASLDKMVFVYKNREITIHLAGSHQLENAVLALEALEALRALGYRITEKQIRSGLEKTQWNGRFTVLQTHPYIIVDGAHNPDAAVKLKKSLQMYFPNRRKIFLMGVLKDKQYEEIARIMALEASVMIAMETPDNPRALPAGDLAQVLRRYHADVREASDLEEAVAAGIALANEEDVIVIFGSLSFIGDITRIVEDKKAESDTAAE